jgi:hypothetical protein
LLLERAAGTHAHLEFIENRALAGSRTSRTSSRPRAIRAGKSVRPCSGARLVGEVVRYGDMYRLCYLRGPEGILIGLAQEVDGALSG